MNQPDDSRRAPWRTNDLVLLIAFVGVGAVLCALAWNGTATRSRLEDQTGWITVGVAGFALSLAGQTWWLRRGRRAVALQAVRVRGDMATVVQDRSETAPRTSRSEALVAADTMPHFHRPECPIAAGRGWHPVSRLAHEAAGRTPCGICSP